MATELQVEIVTPEASTYSGTASEVLVRAWEGDLGILPDHDALLTLLRAGTCVLTGPAGNHRLVLGRGFAEIGGSRITILTDTCIPVGEVDKAKAKADLAAAEEILASADVHSERHRQAEIAAEHAQARLDA